MARTDPKWQKKGVAVYLQQMIAKHSLRLGIQTLRFWVLSTNRPALKAALKGGFKPICEASHISLRVNKILQGNKPMPVSPNSLRLIGSLQKSDYLRKMNGYCAYAWHFVKADMSLWEKLVRRRELYSVDGSQFILSEPEKWSVTNYSSFTILSGPPLPSLRALRKMLRVVRSGAVGAYLPYDRYLLQAAKAAGFHLDEWGRHCVVFEKTFS